MPELPEVETIKRIIEPQLAGQTILSVCINHPQVVAYPQPGAFAAQLTGQTVSGMSRRGKFLTIHLQSGDQLVLHLRMTGQLLVTPADYPAERHTHLVAALSGGGQLRYIDVRRFGRFWLLRQGEPDTLTGQNKLGPEPLGDALTADYLQAKLGRRGKPIKEMLHDQAVVAGIGNIYSDEILYAAQIHPAEPCNALAEQDWANLAAQIKAVLAWAIEANAITPGEYLAGQGKEYRNTPHLRVYGRAGQPCLRCGHPLEKTVIAARSSCYCPNCQRKRYTQ